MMHMEPIDPPHEDEQPFSSEDIEFTRNKMSRTVIDMDGLIVLPSGKTIRGHEAFYATAVDKPGVNLPLQPLGSGRAARHSAIVDRVLDLTVMDRLTTDAAIRKALDELDPHDRPAKLNFVGVLILTLLALVVLAFTIPAAGWIVGHGVLPIWHWGFGWLA